MDRRLWMRASGYPGREITRCPMHVRVCRLDLADLSSVDTFVKDLEAEKSIDFLVLNAGVAGGPLEHVAGTGFEKHMAANHFGHAHLTNLLLPRIKAQNTPCRIVVVASAAHAMGDIDLNDINYKNGRKYSGMKAYGQSKLANILFAKALHDRLKDTQIVTSSLHPGVIATNIWRNAPSWVGKCLVPTFFTDKTVQQGAATQVWACFADGIGGKYLQDCKVKEPKKKAESVNDSDALWEATQKLLAEATTAR
mmetsp:Transcript_17130/g.43268  ORF Transcript_17130/g.43268 Transcript_17130/m.43268 type:complete len:252 (+) Transcript_17130:240-995(+)